MATTLAKPRRTAKQPPATKMCLHCHQVRKLSDFFSNRDWIDQLGKDSWCKKCVSAIRTKDEMKQYFFENNRKWNERIWISAQKKAELAAAKNIKFQKLSGDMRDRMLEALTCEQVPGVMQISYEYIDNSQDINVQSYEEAKDAGKIVELDPKKTSPNVKTYNPFFNGDFKPAELQYLNEYYDGLKRDFTLSDISLQDNAKKLAKAALIVDRLQNDFASGRCSIQDLQNAINFYNTLMNLGNFAASKRKPGDKNEDSSFSEISLYLEQHGFLSDAALVVWPKDSIDETIEEFRYIVSAIDAE